MMVFGPLTSATLQENAVCATTAAEPLQVVLAMPESESVTVPVRVIGEVATVTPGAGEPMETAGGVLSIFRVTDAVAEFPVLSVEVREMV